MTIPQLKIYKESQELNPELYFSILTPLLNVPVITSYNNKRIRYKLICSFLQYFIKSLFMIDVKFHCRDEQCPPLQWNIVKNNDLKQSYYTSCSNL